MKNLLLTLTALCTYVAYGQFTYPYFDGKRWGLSNDSARIILAPQYDSISLYKNGCYTAAKNGKLGTLDWFGRPLLPCRYDKFVTLCDALGTGTVKGKQYLVNFQTGKEISTTGWDEIDRCLCSKHVIIASRGHKYSLIVDSTGLPLGKNTYEALAFRSLDNYETRVVAKFAGKYGFIGMTTGEWELAPEYDRIESGRYDSRTYIMVTKGKEVTYFDHYLKPVQVVAQVPAQAPAQVVAADKPQAPATATVQAPPSPSQEVSMVATGVVMAPGEARPSENLYVYDQGNGVWKVSLEIRSGNATQVKQTWTLNGYSSLKPMISTGLSNNLYELHLLIAIKDGRAGIITASGRTLSPFVYDELVQDSALGCILSKLGGKTGLLDSYTLKEFRKPIFKRIIARDYSLLPVWLVEMPEGQRGYMSMRTGKVYIPGIGE
jgi:hypothetical protein